MMPKPGHCWAAWIRMPGSPRGTSRAIRLSKCAKMLRMRTRCSGAAIDSYASGYRRNPNHYYSGINALTLMHLYRHLTNEPRYDRDIPIMAGAVRFAAEYETDPRAVILGKSHSRRSGSAGGYAGNRESGL